MEGPPDVEQDFASMMRDHVAPALREMGFTGGPGTFTYPANGYDGVIRTQKDMRSTRLRTRITLQVGAVGIGSIEIFRLMPGSGPGRWWELHAGEPAGPVADSVIAAACSYGLPAILAALDGPDQQLDPTTSWPRTFPRVPELGEQEPDGGGGDPSAWYLRAAGSPLDQAIAQFVSDIGLHRLDAAEAMGSAAELTRECSQRSLTGWSETRSCASAS